MQIRKERRSRRRSIRLLTPFLEQDAKLRSFLSRYLDSDIDYSAPGRCHEALLLLVRIHGSSRVCGRDGCRGVLYHLSSPCGTGGIVKITCCDASAMLKDRYDDYEQVVGFSATLKPFDYYAQLSGLDPADRQDRGVSEPLSQGASQAPDHSADLDQILGPRAQLWEDRRRH